MKTQRYEGVTESQVLEVISDRISLDIFNKLAKNPQKSDNLKRTIRVTNKQFYTKCSKLVQAGLIKRRQNLLTVTAFGIVVYHAQMKIARAAEHNFVLDAIDRLTVSTSIPPKERQEVIDRLIDDHELKSIVLSATLTTTKQQQR